MLGLVIMRARGEDFLEPLPSLVLGLSRLHRERTDLCPHLGYFLWREELHHECVIQLVPSVDGILWKRAIPCLSLSMQQETERIYMDSFLSHPMNND